MSAVTIARTERIPDAATRLGVTTRDLYRLIDTGVIPAIRTAAGHLEVAFDLELPAGAAAVADDR